MRTMVAEERKQGICMHQHPTMHQACETRLPTPTIGLQQHCQHPAKFPTTALLSCTRYLFAQDIHAHATRHTNSPRKVTQAQTHYGEVSLRNGGTYRLAKRKVRRDCQYSPSLKVLANICQGSPRQQCRRLTRLRVTHFQVPTTSLPGARALGDGAPAASYTARTGRGDAAKAHFTCKEETPTCFSLT